MNTLRRLASSTLAATRKNLDNLLARTAKSSRVQMTYARLRAVASKSMNLASKMVTDAKNVHEVVDFVGGPWCFLAIVIVIVTLLASVVVLSVSAAMKNRKRKSSIAVESVDLKADDAVASSTKKSVRIGDKNEYSDETPTKFPSSAIKAQSKGTPQNTEYDWDDFYSRLAKTGVLVKRVKAGECKPRCLSLNVKGKLCLHKLPLRSGVRLNTMKPYIKISLMEVKDCFAVDDIVPPQMIIELPTKTIMLSMKQKIDVRLVCKGINALVMNLKSRNLQYFNEVKSKIAEHAIAGKAGGLTARNMNAESNYENLAYDDDNHSVATSNTNLSASFRDGDNDSEAAYDEDDDDDAGDGREGEQLRNNTARNRNRIVALMEAEEEAL